MKHLFVILALLVSSPAMAFWGNEADRDMRAKTEAIMSEANRQIGMPAITNFQERRMAKEMLERRDQKIATHAYIYNTMAGCLVYLGPSIGYGLPYSTQYTNPQVPYTAREFTVPQAEPNGLFMPDSSAATWVMLYNEEKKQVEPIYVEPDVVIAPFRLKNQECGK